MARIEFRVAQRESLKRGWLTYTDLDILARRKLLTETWDIVYDLIINVSVACMTAYLASLVTLVGSAIVVSSLPWNNCSSLSSPPLASSPPAMSSPFTPVTSSNTSSPQPGMDFLEPDPEADLGRLAISEFAFQHPDLDSDAFLKDFTAVAIGTFSHQPKPPFHMTNETSINVTVKNFTDPFVYLQQSYCALIGSIIGFQSNTYALSPICSNILA